MRLDWELCDLKQNVLTRLDNRRGGGRVELGVNKGRAATAMLSMEDPALELAKAIETVLRVVLRGPGEFALPLFIGRTIIPTASSGADGEMFELNALDPLFHLERLLIRSASPGFWDAVTYLGIDQSEIMQLLVELVTGHGIARGTYSASVNRDRTYPPGKDIASALIQMSEVELGPDFELEPIIASDGSLVQLNTFYPKQGSDLSATVKFVHGAGDDTVTDLSVSPAGDAIANRIVAIGAPQERESEEEGEPLPYSLFPSYIAEHAASIALYGAFEEVLQLEDVLELPTLEAHAKAEVAARAFPIAAFDFTAAPEQVDTETGDGIPPVFGRDYWLGDKIAVEDHQPARGDDPLTLVGRVIDAVVSEADTGQLSVKASCITEQSSEGVTGAATVLRIPEGED